MRPVAAELLAFSPDGRTLATASYDGVIRTWDAPAPDPALLDLPAGRIGQITFSATGSLAAAAAEKG